MTKRRLMRRATAVLERLADAAARADWEVAEPRPGVLEFTYTGPLTALDYPVVRVEADSAEAVHRELRRILADEERALIDGQSDWRRSADPEDDEDEELDACQLPPLNAFGV